MIGFFLKKNFFDGWDHLLSLLIPNLLILGMLTGGGLLATHASLQSPAPIPWVILAALWCGLSIATFAFGPCAAEIASFKSVSAKDWLSNLPSSWKDGLLFGLLTGALGVLGSIAILFYLQMEGLGGLFLSFLTIWLILSVALALQWLLPLRSLMGDSFGKCLKKSFIIFLDNPGLSLFLFFYTALLTILSVALLLTIPGPCGVVLARTNALRLLLYKYDWLETHPDARGRQRIPWRELTAEDRENIGPRSLKSFIFPWK